MPANAPEVLDREWLTVRARLIEVAAALDRIDRADGSVADDPRIQQVARTLGILAQEQGNRAEQLQLAFSLPYEPKWRERYGL
jgi:hypothetical protein